MSFKCCLGLLFISLIVIQNTNAESGYKAWLRYQPVKNPLVAADYLKYREIYPAGNSAIITSCLSELKTGFKGMLDINSETTSRINRAGIIIGTTDNIPPGLLKITDEQIRQLNSEAFIIQNTGKNIIITSKTDAGVLYGTFHLLRLMQMQESLSEINIVENPKIRLRLLNHWDNPGVIPPGQPPVERGYAGGSIFKWEDLPAIDPRYIDYARMLASVGINGTVINNVNTAKNDLEGWKLLTPEYLPRLKTLADVFRKYGIKLYISVNFFSPVLVSGLETADPLNDNVRAWWNKKVIDIYSEIPDFGGFLVKADSEGEPGPIIYGRTHADGANMLAEALEPFDGILIWRAFVYGKDENLSPDRACQAYEVFKPLDGMFADNALVQIKNGPIDFQVREPVSPLFGSMPETNQMLEIQITQEYTDQDKHVCFLVPQWKEILDFDTYASGVKSTISRIVDGSLFGYRYSGIAGVSNIGDDTNWTGHLLAQANLYGFGRLVWDTDIDTESITREWILQTFGDNKKVFTVLQEILLTSWITYENYTSPLGVGFMCDGGHFLPDPARRVSYHRADENGVGYDRTLRTGSNYTSQYFEPVSSMYEGVNECPDELLLFFHHVPYTHKLKSGTTVNQYIYNSHNEGVARVRNYVEKWESLKNLIDDERYEHVLGRLRNQVSYAEEWRDSINNYFQKLSK